MEKNVKAVIALMETLDVTLEDVAAALNMTVCKAGSSPEVSNKSSVSTLTYKETPSGYTYALWEGEIIGLVIRSSSVGTFILAHRDYARNLDIWETRRRLENEPTIAGKHWVVPEDKHFYALKAIGLTSINSALSEINGDGIHSNSYLSATSQANKPASWRVRLILPLS